MVKAVVAWLEHQLQDRNAAATQLPLFYLQRGKLNQAQQAYDRLKSSGTSDSFAKLSQDQYILDNAGASGNAL